MQHDEDPEPERHLHGLRRPDHELPCSSENDRKHDASGGGRAGADDGGLPAVQGIARPLPHHHRRPARHRVPPEPDQDEETRFLFPRGIRDGRARLAGPQRLRGAPVLHQRGLRKLHRVLLRGGIRLYHHRIDRSFRDREPAQGDPAVAQHHARHRRHGDPRACIRDHPERGIPGDAHDARRDARPHGRQARSPAEPVQQDPVRHVFRPDPHGDHQPEDRRSGPLRVRDHQLFHGRHRRIRRDQRQHRRLQRRRRDHRLGLHAPFQPELRSVFPASDRKDKADLQGPGVPPLLCDHHRRRPRGGGQYPVRL